MPGRYYHYDDAIATIQESLLRSRLDYFDLYLLHWPNPKQDHYVEAWEALIAAQKFGLVRSIGVSNFLPEYIDRLKAETGVTPAVNQIELHPYFNQLQMIKEMQKRKILTMCWSPLGRANQILEEPKLQNLAEKYHKNIGQIILRWDIQNRALPIPKSKSSQRQKENIDVFDFTLSKEEMDS